MVDGQRQDRPVEVGKRTRHPRIDRMPLRASARGLLEQSPAPSRPVVVIIRNRRLRLISRQEARPRRARAKELHGQRRIGGGGACAQGRPQQIQPTETRWRGSGRPRHRASHRAPKDRKSVVKGKSVSVLLDPGGGRVIKKKKLTPNEVSRQ